MIAVYSSMENVSSVSLCRRNQSETCQLQGISEQYFQLVMLHCIKKVLPFDPLVEVLQELILKNNYGS